MFYSSLKTQYMERQAKMCPSLSLGANSTHNNMEDERMDGADQPIIPLDAVEFRDNEIVTLKNKVGDTMA